MRYLPYLLAAVGAFMLVGAFLHYSAASMPYQDPTSELLAKQSTELGTSGSIAKLGAVLLASGLISHRIMVRARRRSQSRD